MKLIAKKSLGQHFLNSQHAIDQIVDAGNLNQNDNVLEIGPGTGILTRALLAKNINLTAIEKDDRAFALLQHGFADSNNINLIHGDVLEIDFHDRFRDGEFKIIANIPYYITGAILEKFLEFGPRPSDMVILVQKEVAERIVARDHKESILSISIKTFGDPKIVARVKRGAFTPPPTVDSAILSIKNIHANNFKENSISIKKFFEILKSGFAHKRKLLIRNLENIYPRNTLQQVWAQLGLDEKCRAEDMDKTTWLRIVSTLEPDASRSESKT